LFKGNGSYKLNAAETIEVFYNLRTDWDKLNLAINITQIIKDVTYEGQQVYRILQLFLNTLYMISEGEKNFEFLTSVFKLRLVCLLGFVPRIDKCCNCKTKENINSFSFRDNGVKCESCSKQDRGVMEISNSTYKALHYIITSNPKQIFNFEVQEDTLRELNLLAKIYLNEKLEREYK